MPFTISHLNSFSESLRMHEAIVFHNRSRSNQVPDLNRRVLFCLMLKNCIMQRHSQKMKLWFRISAVHNPCIIMHSSCTIHAQYMHLQQKPSHNQTLKIYSPTLFKESESQFKKPSKLTNSLHQAEFPEM